MNTKLPLRSKERSGVMEPRSSGRLLFSRTHAAELLSISPRAIDYLIANKKLSFRKVGTRVLIPAGELKRFAGSDHPAKLANEVPRLDRRVNDRTNGA